MHPSGEPQVQPKEKTLQVITQLPPAHEPIEQVWYSPQSIVQPPPGQASMTWVAAPPAVPMWQPPSLHDPISQSPAQLMTQPSPQSSILQLPLLQSRSQPPPHSATSQLAPPQIM